jgi:guanylate kinase
MITILVGMSASGKDTIARELKQDGFIPLLSCTTRPMREGEREGVDYHFLSTEEFLRRKAEGKFLEFRAYDVFENGQPSKWYYATPKEELDPAKDYIRIVDPDGCKALLEHYGRENCFVVNVIADDHLRALRAKERGGFNQQEWDRRFADDQKKFAAPIMEPLVNLYCYNDLRNVASLSDVVKDIRQALCSYKETERVPGKHYLVSFRLGGFQTYENPYRYSWSKSEEDMER